MVKLLFFLSEYDLIRAQGFELRLFPVRLHKNSKKLGDLKNSQRLMQALTGKRKGIFKRINLNLIEVELENKLSFLSIT